MTQPTFTFVTPGLYGATRIPFDPSKKVPDWSQGGKPVDLLTLYHRDCDQNPKAWIEGVEGEYVRTPAD